MDVVGMRSDGEVEKNGDIRDHGTTEETTDGTIPKRHRMRRPYRATSLNLPRREDAQGRLRAFYGHLQRP
jgi:hypothetical protein